MNRGVVIEKPWSDYEGSLNSYEGIREWLVMNQGMVIEKSGSGHGGIREWLLL